MTSIPFTPFWEVPNLCDLPLVRFAKVGQSFNRPALVRGVCQLDVAGIAHFSLSELHSVSAELGSDHFGYHGVRGLPIHTEGTTQDLAFGGPLRLAALDGDGVGVLVVISDLTGQDGS